jgi:hypothetical protein
LAFTQSGVFAQDEFLAPPKRSFEAVRTETPPTLDAHLVEDAWKTTPVLTNFVDVQLDILAIDQTEFQRLYDDEYFYFAVTSFQKKEDINATIYKYDRFSLRFEDYVQIGFDSFLDRKNAYLFLFNPIGTRWDAREGVYDSNQAWDADWEVETRILDDRWIAEGRIPIGIMHLDKSDDQTWGFNVRRRSSKENESSHWNWDPNSGMPRRANGPKMVADFGRLTNLDLADSVTQRDPLIETYVSSSSTKRQGGDIHTKPSAGMDLDMRISSNWTGQFSVNPDFGEIAADEGDVQNRDTARFLTERRFFFREGAEQFKTPTNLYDSRNFLDFDAAAKITGTGKDWTMATLVLRGDGARSGEDTNFLAARYTKSLTDRLQFGTMNTIAHADDNNNFMTSFDTRYEINSTTFWDTQVMFMKGEDELEDGDMRLAGENEVSAHGYFTEITGGTRPWSWEIDFRDFSKNFLPDLSFIPRQDVIGPTVELNYSQTYQHPVVQSVFGQFDYEYFQNHDGRTTLRDYSAFAGITFQNNWNVSSGFMEDFHDPYDNTRLFVSFMYNRQDRYRSWRGNYAWGEFQTVEFDEYQLTKPFLFTERWTNDLSGLLREEQRDSGDEDVWLWRWESEYNAPWDGRIKMTLEQGSDGDYARTLLFAYEDVKDWDFFLVFNDFKFEIDTDEQIIERGFLVKFVRRW